MSSPRVALVGPIPPWRSGIADQTMRLAHAMERLGVAATVITFRRMYPRGLFPGVTDRDVGETPPDLDDVRPLLDGANPLTFRAAAREVAALDAPLAVLPWWTAFWAPHDALFLRTLGALAPRTVKLLLCHNLFDHERGAVGRALARAVFRRSDRFAVQNRRAAEELSRALPGRPVEVIPHPSEPLSSPSDRAGARARLGISPVAPLFLFTGLLRPYKGWDVLLASFSELRRDFPEALLALAGEPWGEARRLLARPVPDGVLLSLRYLPAAERALWLDACDAVVCPYRHATGSGIAADALSHGRPVIGTRVAGLEDVIEDGESGLLVPPEDVPALAAALKRFLAEGLGPRLSAGAAAAHARFTPEEHARRLLRLGGVEV